MGGRALKFFRRAIAGLLLAGAVAHAHVVGISVAEGRLAGGALELAVGFAPADALQLLGPENRPGGKGAEADFEAAKPRLLAMAPQLWDATGGAEHLTAEEIRVELLPGDNVSFRVRFVCPAGLDRITLRATKLSLLSAGHREFVIISGSNGLTVAKKLLNAQDDTMEINVAAGPPSVAQAPQGEAAPQAAESTFWGFLQLGVEHIWTGYDHLLFLFALLVVCRSFKSIVAIISCFTLAHSITLALATLDLVNLPGRITEPAIAASIVFVGVENLVRRGAEPKGRWALTFAFGLIHGFGFASVLRELGVGANGTSIVMPLFTFNAGVEAGQIAVAAIVLPIVWRLRKNEKFLRVGVPALSAIVTAAGLYWFLERTVFA